MRWLAPLLLGAFVLVGCGQNEKAEEAKIKQGYDKRYTIDDVPAAQRDMVRGMMKGAKPGSASAAK